MDTFDERIEEETGQPHGPRLDLVMQAALARGEDHYARLSAEAHRTGLPVSEYHLDPATGEREWVCTVYPGEAGAQ